LLAFGRDANEYRNVYAAEAHAERGWNLGRWEMTLDYFPLTSKGRRSALSACGKWMDEAERRVAAAKPIDAHPGKSK
jgi:hypothetical protein